MDHPCTVLLLAEEADNLDAMRQLLQRHGYGVMTAADAEQGLELVERRTAQLVVVDLLLPGMSGFRVLEKIKSGPNAPRVVMISSVGDAAQSSFAHFLGADDFIHKPFSLNRLFESVARLCPLPAGARREPVGAPHLLDKVGVHGGS